MLYDNEDYNLWTHEECLIDIILTKTYEGIVEE
jgi:hypothetical protein